MGFCLAFLIVLDDLLYGVVESDEQRYVAGNNLGQCAWRCYLRLTAFVRNKTSQDGGANVLLFLSQRAVEASLLDCRQTMSKRVLIA